MKQQLMEMVRKAMMDGDEMLVALAVTIGAQALGVSEEKFMELV